MFDISFSELALCFIVALVVLGPERLPKVARTVGRWSGQMRAYMRNLTTELERETEIMDIKRQFTEARDALRESAADIEASTRSVVNDVQHNIKPPEAIASPSPDSAVIEHTAPTDPSRPA